MPANFMPSSADYFRIWPELVLTVFGVLIMVIEAIMGDKTGEKKTWSPATVAVIGLLAALPGAVHAPWGAAFSNMLIIDGFADFFRVLVIVIGLLTVYSAMDYLRRADHPGGEFYALLLFSIVGQCVMVTANELIMIFIGLEISSISSYVLAGYLRDDSRNNESALKYFLLGSFATAFLLYGVAWIYGATGSTQLGVIREQLAQGNVPTVMAATLAALILGLGWRSVPSGGASLPSVGSGCVPGRAFAGFRIPHCGS